MSPTRHPQTRGFTLVELLIGMTLAALVMAAVLSSYVNLARNFTRSLGISASDRPPLEAQGRRVLLYLAQDVRMTSGFSGTPSGSSVSFTLPTGTVNYTYYTTATTVAGVAIPANSLVRRVGSGTPLILHTNLLTCVFRYYDNSGNPYNQENGTPYTNLTDYQIGVKQISLTFTAQAGSSTNGTLTEVYTSASPRLLLRNRQLL